jgi:hypothetical protein
MADVIYHRGGDLLNEQLDIEFADVAEGDNKEVVPYAYTVSPVKSGVLCGPPVFVTVKFQRGNPMDGITGASIESLLAICRHRLEGFQARGLACTENDDALQGINAALEALHGRSSRRKAANVEGTHMPHGEKPRLTIEGRNLIIGGEILCATSLLTDTWAGWDLVEGHVKKRNYALDAAEWKILERSGQ